MNTLSLSEGCEFIKDGTHGSPERVDRGVPVLSATHVRDGRLHFDTDRFTSQKELDEFRKRLHPRRGDVLLTIVGTIGRTAVVKEEVPLVFQRSVCVIRPKTNCFDSEYLRHALGSTYVSEQLVRETREVAQAGVYLDSLKSIEVPAPDVNEQKRIAGILENAEKLKRQRRYAQELGDSFLQSTFVQMFGDSVKNPYNFDVEELGEFVEAFEGGVNFNPVAENEPASEWRVLKVSAVTWGEFDPSESKPINPGAKFADSSIVKKGDLLFSRANTTELVGAVARVRNNPPKVLLPDKLWRIKLKRDSKIKPDYLLHALRQPGARKLIGDLATGSSGSMKNISKEKTATLPVLVAPTALQEKFEGVVGRFERFLEQQREASRQAEHLFETLLHRAFRGEL